MEGREREQEKQMEKLSCEVDSETLWTDLMGRSREITTLWCYPSELRWPFFRLTPSVVGC